MKKTILVLATIAITFGAYAQTDSINRKMFPPDINNTNDGMNQNRDMDNNQKPTVQDRAVDKSHPDGVMMQNGKMVIVKNGKMTVLDYDMTLGNGTKIMSNGNYVKKDGTKMTLREGEHMDMSGNMIPMKPKN